MKRPIISFITTLVFITSSTYVSYAQEAQERGKQTLFVPNEPIGEGKGIHPGRVVMVRDSKVAQWNGKDGKWWEEGNIDQKALDSMFARTLCLLTGQQTPQKAWSKIFEYYNKTAFGRRSGYKPGELIAIKINLNNTFETNDSDNEIDQSTQGLRTLLGQLVNHAGVRQEDLIVYDATDSWRRRNIPDRIYRPLHDEFPRVRWMSCNGSEGVEAANWQEGAIQYTSPDVKLGSALPKAVVEARYMINCGLLKGHEFTGQTICAKNHFGTIRFPHRQHNTPTVNQSHGKPGNYSALVDLMGCPNVGKKTVLYIVDGIYGMQTNVGEPQPQRDSWDDLFGGGWSSCILMSQDPVALESVCLDHLYAEFGDRLGASNARMKTSAPNSDNYLREAATGRNAELGEYRPNGVPTGSLGLFEHWDNPTNRHYSKLDFIFEER